MNDELFFFQRLTDDAKFPCIIGSTDIVEHKPARPFPLYSESHHIAKSDFFFYHTIQMQKMSYFKVEPLNHAAANCFFHRRRMMQWFSLMAGSTDIVEHRRARPFSMYSTS